MYANGFLVTGMCQLDPRVKFCAKTYFLPTTKQLNLRLHDIICFVFSRFFLFIYFLFAILSSSIM